MLEHLPRWLGALMRTIRAGHAKLTIVEEGIAPESLVIELSSPAFATGARMPVRFTADGEGVSPPLVWRGVPDDASSLVLLVEDADAPTPSPLLHALVWNMPPGETGLAEGAIAEGAEAEREGGDVGRNSFFAKGWLPPDPPPGHGSHDYVFQLFALSETPDLGHNPGRSQVVRAIRGGVLAAGMLVGTYSRDEPAASDQAMSTMRPAGA
jgi:Raf kinase inhibitor-like YbhB/YbcL family protein